MNETAGIGMPAWTVSAGTGSRGGSRGGSRARAVVEYGRGARWRTRLDECTRSGPPRGTTLGPCRLPSGVCCRTPRPAAGTGNHDMMGHRPPGPVRRVDLNACGANPHPQIETLTFPPFPHGVGVRVPASGLRALVITALRAKSARTGRAGASPCPPAPGSVSHPIRSDA